MKSVKYIVLYLILIQLLLPSFVSLADVYRDRMDYLLLKDNMRDIDPVLQQVKKEIDRRKLDDYIIMLGDSVLWGTPGPSHENVSAFMSRREGAPVVFNLAVPAMQIGDMYTMLLKLDRYGISTDRLMFNIRYASFVERDPYPKAVFWLADDLRELDREAYDHILPQLRAAGYKPPETPYEKYVHILHHDLLPKLSLMAYKDYLRKNLKHLMYRLTGKPIPSDALDDARPWHEKDPAHVQAFLKDEQLIKSFSDKPFDLSERNPDVFFLNKIFEHQQGKKTMVILTATNHALMKADVEKPGYQANLAAIDRFFADKPVRYVNLEGVIPGDYFTDHTHLTKEGNERLAELLWRHWEE